MIKIEIAAVFPFGPSQQIAGLIAGIQAETENAVAAMAVGTQEVRTGAEVVRTAGQSFQEIRTLVAAVSEQVGEAAAATLHIRKPTAQGKLVL